MANSNLPTLYPKHPPTHPSPPLFLTKQVGCTTTNPLPLSLPLSTMLKLHVTEFSLVPLFFTQFAFKG